MEYELARKGTIRRLTEHFGLRMQKKWGQNFLIRPEVVEDIVDAAELGPDDRVLEIGPGIGTLTQGLARTGAQVTAVELDPKLPEILAETLAAYPNVRIVPGDILKTDVRALMGDTPFTVAANLPYYITTPILMYLLEQKLPLVRLVLMMQREVAERLAASPGTKAYGAITLAVQYYTEAHVLFDVEPESFWPAPNVVSSVVEFIPRKQPPVDVRDEKLLFRLVKIAFAQRRKTFRNNIKSAGYESATADALLVRAEIDGGRRGETFSLEEFARLANVLYELEEAK